jgi:histidyl-tRNA synthetase
LTEEDQSHFEAVQSFLNALNIPFILDSKMVRGIDYYTRTTFEITSTSLGAQDALLGGGRYDNLVEDLGGKPTPAIGFAAGMERILLAMGTMDESTPINTTDIYMVNLDLTGLSVAIKLTQSLRQAGFDVQFETLRRSMKAQMREANRSGAKYAFILGETEIQEKTVVIKNLNSGEQETKSIANIDEIIKNLTI